MIKKRVVELDELDWQWLVGWFENLFKLLPMDSMNGDTLRMGAILRQLREAKSEDAGNGGTKLGEADKRAPGKKNK